MTGSGGDIKVNETAKVVCGGIQAQNARIYLIDTVLDPAEARRRPITPRRRRHDRPTTTTTETTTTETTPAAPDRADARRRR